MDFNMIHHTKRISQSSLNAIYLTRKYPLRGYILGVLTHTTAWDQLWGGDLFLRSYIRYRHNLTGLLELWPNWEYAPRLRLGGSGPTWGVRVTQDAHFSLLIHTKQLLLVTFCDTLARIEVSFWPDGTGTGTGTTDGRTDKRGSQNSYLDSNKFTTCINFFHNFLFFYVILDTTSKILPAQVW